MNSVRRFVAAAMPNHYLLRATAFLMVAGLVLADTAGAPDRLPLVTISAQ